MLGSKFPSVIATLEQCLDEATRLDYPVLIAELERLKAIAWMRMGDTSTIPKASTGESEDRLLTTKEAAIKLGLSKDYLYRHAQTFPFTVRIGARHLRFSFKGIERYISTRRGR